MRAVWVVQDRESGLFLRPFRGDVGTTRRLSLAGRFDTPDEAVEASDYHLDGFGEVIGFFEDEKAGADRG
jgi:hypothetical protein